MEVAMVAAFLNTFVPKVYEALKERSELQFSIMIDIDFIKQDLELVAAVIEDCELPSKGTSSKALSKLIDQARELARDTEDCIYRYLHPSKPHPRLSHAQFKLKISSFRQRVVKVNDDLKALSSSQATSNEAEDRHVDPSCLVGMDEPLKELLELVQQPAWKRKVISIVGFGGVGKTLLARQVYDGEVGGQFELRARVTAAGKGEKEVLKKILEQVEPGAANKHDTLDSEKLGKHLASYLNNRKYLIVIDDMRTMDLWDDIKSALPDSVGVDSRVIVTTTIQSVAIGCSCSNSYVYKLPPLDKRESVKLFLKDMFPKTDRSTLKAETAEILKKCGGLPLALVSMSEFLRNCKSYEDAGTKLGSCLVEEGGGLPRMRRVLVNKYTSLSGHDLKACLLYFCMFPCDNSTRRNSLIRRWQAEGFVAAKPNCSPQDVARLNLEDLIDRNIIQSMEVSTNGNVKRCGPHGMMQEYISYKSMYENFATLVLPAKRIRRLFLHHSRATDKQWISDIDLSRVRTLAVSGEACDAIMEFDKYNLLGVLDLKDCYYQLNTKQLNDLGKLLLLKYLSLGNLIENSKLPKDILSKRNLPRDIGRLIHLETLEMRRNGEPVGVYKEVIELTKLKHLIGKFELLDNPGQDLVDFLSKNCILDTLAGFVIGKRKGFPQLMSHMGHLRKVKIWCDSSANKANLIDVSKAIKEYTRQGTNMGIDNRSLSIDLAKYSEVVMESLKHSGSLASLKFRGKITQFLPSPQEIFVSKMKGIQELCLSSTNLSGVVILAALSKLAVLKYLKLVEDNLGPLVLTPERFKGLERLCLVCMPSLDIKNQPRALPNLVSLHMMCKALDGLAGIHIGLFGRLKEIALDAQVDAEVKDDWKYAAKGHPNRPDVFFIEKA